MVRHMQPMKKNMEHHQSLPAPTKVPAQYREIMKAYAEKTALTQFRHEALLRQQNANYVGEHNRITGHLNSIVGGLNDRSIERLRNRQTVLRDLARTGLGFHHQLFELN